MDRRSFLFGAGASLIAAPAIVRAASLMPVKKIWWGRFEPLPFIQYEVMATGELYGRSPTMIALPKLENLLHMKQLWIENQRYTLGQIIPA